LIAPERAVRSFHAFGPKSGRHASVPSFSASASYSPLRTCQVAALVAGGGRLVEVDREAQLLADPPADGAGDRHAVVHAHAAHRHERAHVGAAVAGVGALVPAHVDQLAGAPHHPEGGLGDALGRADEGDHRAVRVGAGGDVQQADALDLLDHRRHRVDDAAVAALADVRHALDELVHGRHLGSLPGCRRPIAAVPGPAYATGAGTPGARAWPAVAAPTRARATRRRPAATPPARPSRS
jgi:hypothetical protein